MENLLDEMMNLCRNTGAFQMSHFRGLSNEHVRDKGLNQLVSFVDIESERMLVDGLQKLAPGSTFVTEENTITQNQKSDRYWIIDPLDGTTNFLHGLGAFSISLAFVNMGEITHGVVYVPEWNEMFSAEKNKGARLNGNPLLVSTSASLSESLIATGFPYYEFEQMQSYLAVLADLMRSTHGLRRWGSAAIDLAYVAASRFDGFFETGLNAWDVAAGVLLVEEAGGRVSDFRGEGDYIFGKTILACNGRIYEEFLRLIRTHMS